MISSFELRNNTWKIIGEKLVRGDMVSDALDTVMFKQAAIQLALELKEKKCSGYWS